ncbi:putative aldouronate transport system permease protein [Paenibacillus qinlingensis]|uniref:Aldouronate transport system permease protein n=1 Tax=Paenibacillus qinlingensis TaxID=1837343 RepID=A0ABU1P1K1_9BACL|nr:putative aldouronate transport system permease protein [Paenibacillus qinlingensis]
MIYKQTKSDTLLDFAIYIALSFVLLITLYPLIFILSASISNPVDVLQGKVWLWPKGLNFEAYTRVFQNKDIIVGFRNTIIFTVLGTAFNLLMTTLGAYPLSRKDLFGRNKILLFFTLTMFFSGGLIPTYLVIKQLGLFNSPLVMIIPGAVTVWNLIIMKTYFQTSIPYELQEAAFIDGCSNTKVLTKVILPLSLPIVAVMVLFYGVGHWNAFFNALIYLNDRSMFPLQLILREILIQNQMQDMLNSGVEISEKQLMMVESIKYSVIVVSSIPVLLLYPLLQRYFVKGVMIGAIKG